MKNTKILYLSTSIISAYLLYSSIGVFAQSQTFDENLVPQTMISTPRASNQCFKVSNYAFYDGQAARFYSTLSSNSISNTLRIINTATGQNGVYSSNGAADSSKEYIYNPFGSLSTSGSFIGENSFIPNFIRTSNIKPANIQSVYVSRQYSSTYFIRGSGSTRGQIAGQVVHNIWRRAPSSITNGGLTYSYMEFPSQITGSKQLTLSRATGGGRDRTDNNEYLCNNIYVAKCGDTILDNTGQAGGNDTNGKQGISTNNGFIKRQFSGSFIGEVCDSHNLSGEACVNGTTGCCNDKCNDYVLSGNGICGDGIPDLDGLDDILGNQDDEKCDLGPWNETTQIGNNDSYRLSPCATYCEINPEPETLPEELG